MKKILFSAVGLTALLGLASCSQEDVLAPAGDGVNITVRLPHSLASRATTFGDGTDAGDNVTLNNLAWTVFEVGADGKVTPVFSDSKTAFATSQTEETVTLPLAKGKTYQVAFYADDSANEFATYDGGQINIDYSKGVSNEVAEDVFCGKSTQFKVDGAYAETVTLTRPFAQLNWGTDDLEAPAIANLTGLTAEVSVSAGLFTGFDVLAGDVVEGTEYASAASFGTIDMTDLPAQAFPYSAEGKTYALIAMNYLLTGDGVIDCTLTFNNGLSPVAVNAAPVEINHRTNIYGSLLTAPAEFNIIVNNAFDAEDYDLFQGPSIWDGSTVTTPVVDDNAKTVTLAQASDLAGLSEMVNKGDFPAGYTVLLTKDMDMDGKTFTPVGNAYQRNGDGLANDAGFVGVIDGQNHKISNVNIDGSSIPEDGVAAVFTTVKGADSAIKNINFVNLTIDGGQADQVGAIGLVVEGATVENVNILSGSMTSNKAAGLVARMMRTGSIINCNNAANITSKTGNAGGIVGAAYYNSTEGKMLIENCNNTGNITSGNVCAGGIVGLSAADIKNCTNSGTISVTNNSVGGIAGGIYSSGVISGNTNNGKVINTGGSIGTAGIVGWIRYQTNKEQYPLTEIVVVENNINNADITGGSAVGGIVGDWYYAGKCLNNKNYANSISTTVKGAFAAGIIGTSQFIANGDPFPGENLIVTGNTSTTALDNIEGQYKASIVYVNNAARVTLSDNTPNQQ